MRSTKWKTGKEHPSGYLFCDISCRVDLLVISLGAILAIPFDDIINNQEYALAAGANQAIGHLGDDLVIIGALLATSSAISGTVFGASRQMPVIAADSYLPAVLAKRVNTIPV